MSRLQPILICLLALAGNACTKGPSPSAEGASAPQPASAPKEPAKAANPLTLQRFDGSSVVTTLGYGIKVNKDSSLKREWYVITDPASPVRIVGPAGIETRYTSRSGSYSGEYETTAAYTLKTTEPVTAVEIHVQVFDVFGRTSRALRAMEVADFSDSFVKTSAWRATEHEVAEAFSSVIYVSSVRTAAGKVYSIDSKPVIEHLRAVSTKITEADLEPKR